LRPRLEELALYPRGEPGDGWRNRLIHGDLRASLAALRSEFRGKVNVIYIDPPFDTGDTFSCKATVGRGRRTDRGEQLAYEDRWGVRGDYLAWLRETFEQLIELLHPRGSLFVHLDWRASHHARLLLDELLTPRAFRAEIIWRYRRWPTRTPNLQRMHDTLLYYASGPDVEPVFHTIYEPLAPSTQKTFGTRKQRADFSSGSRRPGVVDEESPGVPLSDVWDIGIVAPSGRERLGYPTQKPEALLERVLRLSSGEGDLVLDCCCGSGTTAAVAERLGRRWIACDLGGPAVQTTLRRLLARPGLRPLRVQRVEGATEPPRGQLAVRTTVEGWTAEVELRGYRGVGGRRGLSWVGAWSIDGLHEGARFLADGWFCRPHRKAPLETRARLTFRRAGVYPISIRAQDLLGNEARWDGEITVPGFHPGPAAMR
jgi:DNA modification methylase